jgi:Tol biopolymer transport system component
MLKLKSQKQSRICKHNFGVKMQILKFSLFFCLVSKSLLFAASVKVEKGNVFLCTNKYCIQITFNGRNSDPYVSEDGTKVVYVHRFDASKEERHEEAEIVLYETQTQKSRVVLKEKPSKEVTEVLQGFSHLIILPDNQTVYFSSWAWATSDAIHSLNLQSLETKFITDGNAYGVIRSGKYKGYLLVNKHRYRKGGGSYDVDWLVSTEGKTLRMVEKGETFDIGVEKYWECEY